MSCGVRMHKVAGIGINVLLVGDVVRIALSGTSARQGETVVINSGDARNPTEIQPLGIVILLGFDAICWIEDPRLVDAPAANEIYDPDELVLGVAINGDACAYPGPLSSRHETVNDVFGGKPIAVTC